MRWLAYLVAFNFVVCQILTALFKARSRYYQREIDRLQARQVALKLESDELDFYAKQVQDALAQGNTDLALYLVSERMAKDIEKELRQW